jgi:hypothetical protein
VATITTPITIQETTRGSVFTADLLFISVPSMVEIVASVT